MRRFAALLALCAACSGNGPATPAARNLVLVVLDTLRPDHLGCYGYERETSPALDAFAAEAIVFENAQSASPWTAPALHSLVTGLYPSVHGVRKYPNPGRMHERVTTLAEVLESRGFATGALTEGGYARAEFGLGQGFGYFPESEAFKHFIEGRTLDRERLRKQVASAAAWIEEQGDERFFLLFHTYRPHIPWDAFEQEVRRFRPDFDEAAEHAQFRAAVGRWNAKEALSRDDWMVMARHLYHCNLTAAEAPTNRALFGELLDKESRVARSAGALGEYDPELVSFAVDLYDAATRHTDGEIGRLFETLESLGRKDDTLVVVVSDHGEGLGEHLRMQHGKVLHEEALRVVLLMRVPGTNPVARPRRVPSLVRSVDVMPTLLELLGVDASALHLNGRSLVPLLRRGVDEPIDELPAFSLALNKPDEEDRYATVRTADWRLVLDRESGNVELYDRRTDPGELRDVRAAHPDVVRRLRELLEQQLAADEELRRVVSGEVEWSELDADVRAELDGLGYTGE
jgi:arylsulfatase A-like enzyme